MSLRDWLLVFGMALLALILAHGYYRMRKADVIRMKLDKRFAGKRGKGARRDEEPPRLREELPHGGARVVAPPERDWQASASQQGQEQQQEQQEQQEEDIIVINVLAKREPFQGRALAEVVRARGLVFGEMDIFHQMQGEAPAFSLASAIEPGTFDLARLDSFETQGVTLFMMVKESRGPLSAFNDMLDLAKTIADQLHGEVCDRHRNPMTLQSIARCRESIRELRKSQFSG